MMAQSTAHAARSRHDINNIFAQILACAEAAWDAAGDRTETRRHLDLLMERAEAAARLVLAGDCDG